MSYPDLILAPCTTPQVVTAAAVSEHVLQWPSDLARQVFIHSQHLLRVIVSVAPADLDSGIRFEYRFATNAALTGTPLVVADSGILLPAVLTANSVHEFRIKPIALPLGYDFSGGWFNVVSESASGGFALYWDMVDGADNLDPVNAAP